MKRLLCLLGSHNYAQHHIEGGSGTYMECRPCGKVDDSFDPKGKGGDPGGPIGRPHELSI
jgi:hypothetical protein